MTKTKIAIVVRKDLDLLPGKWMAQVAHASFRCMGDKGASIDLSRVRDYSGESERGLPQAVTLYVKSERALLNLWARAKEIGVGCALQVDKGHNEVTKGTATVLVIGPASSNLVDDLTCRLQVWRG